MEKRLKKCHGFVEKAYPVFFVLLTAWIAFLCFYRLGVKYVDPYDEAQHGINAYEMLRQGKLFVNTYLYEKDYYNLKPPLSMWMLMGSFKLFGNTVFALRFFSGVCYVLTAVLTGLFARRYGRLESLLVLGFLSANTTPFAAHMIRSGDADSLYVLLFTLAMLCMLKITENQKNLYLCGLFFALAFLTKSYHAGVIVVIGGLFLILTGEIKKMNWKVWITFLLSAALPVVIWAAGRFCSDGTAFFKNMILTDVVGRSSEGFGSNEGPFTYYLQYFLGTMSKHTTVYLVAFVICLVGCVAFNHLFTREHYRKVIGYVLWIMIPFLAFSAVSTKLLWYLYPVLIPLLMVAGILAARLIRWEGLIPAGRILVALIITAVIINFSRGVYTTILEQEGNSFQDFLARTAAETADNISEKNDMSGGNDMLNAYIVYGQNEAGEVASTWARQDVFLAEINGDLRCRQGGLEALEAEKDSAGPVVFYVEKTYYDKTKNNFRDAGFQMQEESDGYVFLVKE